MWVSPNKAISFSVQDGISVTVQTPSRIPDEDWHEYVNLAFKYATAKGLGIERAISLSPKEGPTAAQRKLMVDKIKPVLSNILRIAVLSESPIVRGSITAMSWFVRGSREIKSFKPNQYRVASEWITADKNVNPDEFLANFVEQAQALGFDPETMEYRNNP